MALNNDWVTKQLWRQKKIQQMYELSGYDFSPSWNNLCKKDRRIYLIWFPKYSIFFIQSKSTPVEEVEDSVFTSTRLNYTTVYIVIKKWNHTVKLERAKLLAKAAGKLIRRKKYLRMQAKISAGTDCLRFLRVTGGNLPAPAGNSHEVFIVRVRAEFFKPRDVSFYPVPNTLIKWWSLQIWFCSKNVELFLAGSSNRYPKKPLAEKVFTTIKMIGKWLLSLESKEETT